MGGVVTPDWRDAERERRAPRRASGDRFVLLGTAGGSNPKATRCGYSNAVIVGDRAYLVDCGEGVHRQMWRAGMTLNPNFSRGQDRPLVAAVFVTHLHADHTMDLVNLIQGSWPQQRLDVYGPGPAGLPIPGHAGEALVHGVFNPAEPTPGLRSMVDLLHRAFALNMNARLAADGRYPVANDIHVHEIGTRRADWAPDSALGDIDLGIVADAMVIEHDGVPDMEPIEIYADDRVRVSTIAVQHAPVFPAVGYRFDTEAGSVVFSGDTGPCANVIRLARGADYLVHDTVDIAPLAQRVAHQSNREAILRYMRRSHTSVDEIGQVAEAAGVGTLILSHLVPAEMTNTEAEWEARARAGSSFTGEIVCGVDLDEFELGPRPA